MVNTVRFAEGEKGQWYRQETRNVDGKLTTPVGIGKCLYLFVVFPSGYVSHLVVIVKEVNSIHLDPEEQRMCLSVRPNGDDKKKWKKLCTEKI